MMSRSPRQLVSVLFVIVIHVVVDDFYRWVVQLESERALQKKIKCEVSDASERASSERDQLAGKVCTTTICT